MGNRKFSALERSLPFIVTLLALVCAGAIGVTSGSRFLIAGLLTIASLAFIAGVVRLRRSQAATPIAPPPSPPVVPQIPDVIVPVAPPPPVEEAPPTVSEPSVPIILPAPGPLFIGREQELDHLIAAIRRARGAMAIAIIGPAGVGKGALISRALEAHRAEETFPDGYSWHLTTDYHGDRGFRRLLIEVLDRLGGPAVAMTSTLRMGEAAVADLVRGKRILIWLDDVPEDFPIGRAMTTLTARDEQGIGPTLIISSRQDWAMPEITEIMLEPPQLDEALDFLREWMDLGGRETAPEDYDALKAICINLSSLPLALRMAAGFAAQSGAKLPKLAADLGSVVYPPGDVLRTAQKMIGFVETALFPQPRRSFAALSVFETPVFELDAACAVAATVSGTTVEGTQNDIEAMARLGLLEFDGDEHHPRLRLHPLVRAYAQERLRELGPEVTNMARATLASITTVRGNTGVFYPSTVTS
jgi:NB-ARC domain